MSNITLNRGRYSDIIVLNVRAPTEDKSGDIKDNFHEETERVLDQFPKYLMNNSLEYFSAKGGRGIRKERYMKVVILWLE
jgi:hypothetical protein